MNSARRWDKRSAIWSPDYSSVIGGDSGIWGGTAAYKYKYRSPICIRNRGSVLYVCTKFEGDSSILSKVIKGVQKFGN